MELGARLAGVAVGGGPEVKDEGDGAELAGEWEGGDVAGSGRGGGHNPPYKSMDDFHAIGAGEADDAPDGAAGGGGDGGDGGFEVQGRQFKVEGSKLKDTAIPGKSCVTA